MATTSTVYCYSASTTGGSANYKVGAAASTPTGTLSNTTLSTAHPTFTFGGATYTYLGGADQNSGAGSSGTTEIGFLAKTASGALAFFSTGPFTGNTTVTLNTSESYSVCFLRGTMLATAAGETAVEDLRVGDRVATRAGGETSFRPVTWIGHRAMDVANSLAPFDAYPVRIRAQAFAANVPHRDLLVTAEHCIFVDGKLIPARMLVNGGSIIVDSGVTRYEYFHVELETHSILIAEGLETESYLATGNRGNFANAPVPSMRPDFTVEATHKSWERDAAAPLAVDRETVEPIWRRLMDRAVQLGLAGALSARELAEGPDLRLVTDSGLEIPPLLFDGTTYAFVVPGGATSLRLVSRASRPSDTVGSFLNDRRELGVLVGAIGLAVGPRRIVIDAHQQTAALAGWHEVEAGSAYRWTDGDAVLPMDLAALNGKPAALDIKVIHGGPYLPDAPQASCPELSAAA